MELMRCFLSHTISIRLKVKRWGYHSFEEFFKSFPTAIHVLHLYDVLMYVIHEMGKKTDFTRVGKRKKYPFFPLFSPFSNENSRKDGTTK